MRLLISTLCALCLLLAPLDTALCQASAPTDPTTMSQATYTEQTISQKIIKRNSSNDVLFSMVFRATFRFNGHSSLCTSATVSQCSSSANWKITKKEVTFKKNVATLKYTAKRYFLGIPIQTISRTVTMSCNEYGTIAYR